MTREKKEILKQLNALDEEERLEYRIGPLSQKSIDALSEEIGDLKRPLLLRLNELMHGRLNDYFRACVV